MIDPGFAQELADEWIAAWNSHDLERVLSHYSDDFEMASPKIVEFAGEPSGVLRGKAAIGAYWRAAMAKVPGLHFELQSALVGSRSVAIHYKNQFGKYVIEVVELDDQRRIIRAAAHY